jgi:trehalose synthase-fused probable maltokinase
MTDVRAAVAAGDFDFLGEDRLHEWVVAQRWFASKSREIASINVLDAVTLAEDAPLLSVLMLEARFATGTHEVYQLPVGLRPASEEWSEGVICEIDGWTIYDALTDTEHGRRLLALMRDDADHGEIRFRRVPEGPEIVTELDVRPTGAEQSNTSVIFGDQLFLKIFRRLEAGDNPELELLRFLTAHGFENIAPLSGWYEYEGRLIDATLGIVEGFLPSGRDGWELTLDKLAANDESLSRQLHELGEVTGEMHSVLGSDSTDPRFAPERPSSERLSLIFATLDEQIERVWSDLPEDIEALEPLQGRAQDVREVLQALSHTTVGGLEIRTHGDYHLGQTMLTDRGWVILDFEGEPAAPLSERRLKRSPLRDVAGMLRSFSYAASAARRLRDAEVPEGWEQAARDSFLEGYFSRVEDALLPPGQQATRQLLAVFELEKAIYELRYELNNRPDWVGIPVAGIQRLLEAA